MATEPTLGVRILAGAVGLSLAWNRATVDRSMAKLRALAARADAAERGMVATVRRDLASQEWYRHSWLGSEAKGAAKDAADTEYTEALAAWRALGEVQP